MGTNPAERLDVLDGRVRIRQLPDDDEAEEPYKVIVVDASNSPTERGVVKWKNISGLGACGSGWSLNGNNAVTAFDGNPCPPQTADFVGIGLNDPIAKLDVLKDGPAGVFDYGMRLRVATTTQYKVGLDLSILTSGTFSWGYRAKVEGALYNYGMDISAVNGPSGGQVFGGRFFAQGGNVTSNDNVRGITTGSSGATGGNFGWALWADGKAFLSTGMLWSTSDEQLKQDIEDLDRADVLDKLLAIETKSYSFNADEYGFMGLEAGLQRGVISGQLEQLFPDLVREVHRAGRMDDEGNAVEPDVDFKAVNYMGLIPVLIASVQAQQQLIGEQNARLDQMQADLAACCANPESGRALQRSTGAVVLMPEDARTTDHLLCIVPNPFSEPPMVYYTLERGGHAQLLVNGGDGRGLRVLQEANMEPGNYQLVWDTNSLAPGMYYVTLLLDGQPVVQKAVKVAR